MREEHSGRSREIKGSKLLLDARKRNISEIGVNLSTISIQFFGSVAMSTKIVDERAVEAPDSTNRSQPMQVEPHSQCSHKHQHQTLIPPNLFAILLFFSRRSRGHRVQAALCSCFMRRTANAEYIWVTEIICRRQTTNNKTQQSTNNKKSAEQQNINLDLSGSQCEAGGPGEANRHFVHD